MGFFDFFKPRNKENIEECWPGGKILQVHVEYDTVKDQFIYIGRYGLRFTMPRTDVSDIVLQELSHTHGVVQLLKEQVAVGTTDVMPHEACNVAKQWLDERLYKTSE